MKIKNIVFIIVFSFLLILLISYLDAVLFGGTRYDYLLPNIIEVSMFIGGFIVAYVSIMMGWVKI